jgi:hypothetical protein
LGATTPGHFPGELSPAKQDYSRWFQQIKDMHAKVIRVYTILPAYFYQALLEFNLTQAEPLWLIQGIWSPEEALIGSDGNGHDAFDPAIVAQFRSEIADAVRVVHGDIVRPPNPGHGSGIYNADVSRYLLGWLVGTEWYQYAVTVTNASHPGSLLFTGTYFRATSAASPFESWLAMMLEQVAVEEMRYGWQHPVAFVNWLTTDPLAHPSEPNSQEDLVSVDATHVMPTAAWRAGYYAAYHVYPYFPDFMRWDPKYLAYRDINGNINPYAGYLHELRAYHAGIPMIIAEFGVPSSRGIAHHGPLGLDQGLHTEAEQAKMDADLLAAIYNEDYDGGIVFEWEDEWFKTTWNTIDLELPPDRKAFWLNRLTNERFFGMIAVEPSQPGSGIILDGNTSDWDNRPNRVNAAYPAMDLSVTHDEAYLHLLLKKRSGAWDFSHDVLNVGFQTLPGGSTVADQAPGIIFSQPIQFLLQIKGAADSHLYVQSAYDQHTYRWGVLHTYVPLDVRYQNSSLGIFLPWKLMLVRAITLPLTGQRIPTDEVEIGVLRMGITDPNSPDYDSLADWYAKDDILEVRIPWMMLGFMDPSSLQVWTWPYTSGGLNATPTNGVWVEPHLSIDGTQVPSAVNPVLYSWSRWDLPTYHERPKATYFIMRQALNGYYLPKDLQGSGPPIICRIRLLRWCKNR